MVPRDAKTNLNTCTRALNGFTRYPIRSIKLHVEHVAHTPNYMWNMSRTHQFFGSKIDVDLDLGGPHEFWSVDA